MCAAVGKVKLGAASSPALLLSLRLGWSPRGPAWGEHPQCWFNQGGGSGPAPAEGHGRARRPQPRRPQPFGAPSAQSAEKVPVPLPSSPTQGQRDRRSHPRGQQGTHGCHPGLPPVPSVRPTSPFFNPTAARGTLGAHPHVSCWGSGDPKGQKRGWGDPCQPPRGVGPPHVSPSPLHPCPVPPWLGRGAHSHAGALRPPCTRQEPPRGVPHPTQHPKGGGRGQDVGQTHSHGCLGTVLGTQGGQDVTDAVPAPSGPRPWSTQPQSVLRGPLPW